MKCPNCNHELSEEQLKSLWAEFCGKQTSQAKATAAAANGKKGGRPVTYFKDFYEAIPEAIEALMAKLRDRRERHIFDIERSVSENPTEAGFNLRCDDQSWIVSWNGLSNHVEARRGNRLVAAYNNVNNSAKTAARRIVEDIHREKLMGMPEDFSDLLNLAQRASGQSS